MLWRTGRGAGPPLEPTRGHGQHGRGGGHTDGTYLRDLSGRHPRGRSQFILGLEELFELGGQIHALLFVERRSLCSGYAKRQA